MNLRLDGSAERALRQRAADTGHSQQELVRAAVDRFLHLPAGPPSGGDLDSLVAAGRLRPPRTPYRRPAHRLPPPPGVSTAYLLERDDRVQ